MRSFGEEQQLAVGLNVPGLATCYVSLTVIKVLYRLDSPSVE